MRGRSEHISMDKLPPCFLKGIILEGRWCENTCNGGYVDMHVVGEANQLLIPVVPSNVSPQSAHNDKSQDS